MSNPQFLGFAPYFMHGSIFLINGNSIFLNDASNFLHFGLKHKCISGILPNLWQHYNGIYGLGIDGTCLSIQIPL
jgi:hypothetical protein